MRVLLFRKMSCLTFFKAQIQNVAACLDKTSTLIHSIDEKGRTALHIAVCTSRIDILELLLLRGAKPDVRDNDGWTPLSRSMLLGQSKRSYIKFIYKRVWCAGESRI